MNGPTESPACRAELWELWKIISTLTRLTPDLELKFKAALATVPAMSINDLLSPLEEMAMEEGEAKASRRAIIDAVEARVGSVPDRLVAALEKTTALELLRNYLRLAVTEPSLEQLLAKLPTG